MKRTRLPPGPVGTPTQKSLPKLRLSTLALAAAVTFGLASPDAFALALGRVTVQSALGEPLRADIDVPEINAEEVASLKASIASPTQFRAAGLEYSPALANVQITLQRRANGSYFLHLASDRAITDPFVDVILETSWASGRVQRDFTLLFDPPATRQAAPGTPLPAQVSPPTAAQRPAAPSAAARPAPAPSRAAAPSGEAGKRVTVQSGETAGRIAASNKPASVSLDQMLVAMLRSNPNAFIGGNVNRLRAGAVLDMPSGDQAAAVAPGEARQAIVAQSRDFSEFRRRLAEGVPSAGAPGAGRQVSGRVQGQVEDRNAPAGPSDRLTLSKGGVQGRTANADRIARERAARDQATRVAELNKNLSDLNKLSSTTPGSTAGTGTRPGPGVTAPAGVSAAPRAASAPAAAAKPASAPAAATAKPASAPVVAAAPAAAAKPASAPAPVAAAPASAARPASAPAPAAAAVTAAPKASAAAPAAAVTAATPASTAAAAKAASAPAATTTAAASPAPPVAGVSPATAPGTSASAPGTTASAPRPAASTAAAAVAAAKPPAVRKPPAPPPPEPSLLDDVLENPLIPALGVGLLAVLAGFGFYKMRQKGKTSTVDSSFLESRLQPDSFFGASGGQRIDTAEANNPTGSSMVYSPSQLDAAGDVDPVAEADVYLAYGRDLQAEEILKEALRVNPQRVAIHSKLLEIYAKRRDVKAFEVVAAEAYSLTQGSGPEWEHICELGRELDASNPLYRPGGQPGAAAVAAAAAAVAGAAVASAAAAGSSNAFTSTQAVRAQPPAPAASDVDLDLDFSLGDEPETIQPPPPAAAVMPPPGRPEPVAATPAPVEPVALRTETAPPLPPMDMLAPEPQPARLETPALNVDENSLNFVAQPLPAPSAAPVAAPAAAADNGMLEFDLGGLSLDLPDNEAPAASAAAPVPTAPAPAAAPAMSLDMAPLNFDVAPPTTVAGAASAGAEGDGDSPLATKLALAEEFNAIGDADGARSLAEEVLAEASGDLKSRAQRLLAEIG